MVIDTYVVKAVMSVNNSANKSAYILRDIENRLCGEQLKRLTDCLELLESVCDVAQSMMSAEIKASR